MYFIFNCSFHLQLFVRWTLAKESKTEIRSKSKRKINHCFYLIQFDFNQSHKY